MLARIAGSVDTLLICASRGLLPLPYVARQLRHDSSHDIGELFGESGDGTASADVVGHFPQSLYDSRICCNDGSGALWILLQRFRHGIFDDAYFRSVQCGIDSDTDDGVFADHHGSCASDLFDAGGQLYQTVSGRLRRLVVGWLRSGLLDTLRLMSLRIRLRRLIGLLFVS